MTKLRIVEPGVDPESISTALFEGGLLAFQNLQSIAPLLQHTKAAVEAALETNDPLRAEQHIEPSEFRRCCFRLRKALETDATTQSLWQAVLSEIGFDPDDCFHDRLRLRIVPSKAIPEGRIVRPLPIHRDTWGSGIMAQVNWWLPLYPLAKTRTMIVWPDAFDKPVDNTSKAWDFAQIIDGQDRSYPLLPSTDQTIGQPMPIVIEPGTVLAFAAAHLHAGTNDGSGLSRISFDTRTVWQKDLMAGRAAPNVDGEGKDKHWEWFTPPLEIHSLSHAQQDHQMGATS